MGRPMQSRLNVVTVVLAVGGLVVAGCSASSSSRSAAEASASPVSGASVSPSTQTSAAVTGPPSAPSVSWKVSAPHQGVLTVRTQSSEGVFLVEAVVDGQASAVPGGCVADPAQSSEWKAAWTCEFFGRQGEKTVLVRAVNSAGASEWSEASVTLQRGSCTDAVALAGACEEFDTGPGGGFVFYDAGSRQSWGQYLEAAPKGWAGTDWDPKIIWCDAGPLGGKDVRVDTSFEIGTGAVNTQRIIEMCGTDTAAGRAAAYRGGGKADWFLPSLDESRKLEDRRTETNTGEGMWSSTRDNAAVGRALLWWVDTQDDVSNTMGTENAVRPIRAF